jgi:hypothetical protein
MATGSAMIPRQAKTHTADSSRDVGLQGALNLLDDNFSGQNAHELAG